MQQTQKVKGFGLAEVLLASGVLILVVASVVALSRFVIRGYALTASRTQATYLAQEGLELVRNVRDTYWIDGNPSTDFNNLSSAVSSSACTVSWSTTNWPNGSRFSGGCPENITLGQTTFHRRVQITGASVPAVGTVQLSPHMRRVIVTVDWDEGGKNWTVTAETYLSNWKPES